MPSFAPVIVSRNCMQMINPSDVLTEANNNACTMLIKVTTPAKTGTAQPNAMIPLPSLRDCSVRVSPAYCSELLSLLLLLLLIAPHAS